MRSNESTRTVLNAMALPSEVRSRNREDIGHAAASNFRILFDVATECPNVPAQILIPRNVWSDKAAYEAAAKKLAGLFTTNFTAYDGGVSAEVKAGGPVAPV